MPVVTVQQGPRPTERKRELVSLVTDAFVHAYGKPPEAVQVWIHEVAPESWGMAGRPAADADRQSAVAS
ncbi:4-oxalocrotonate tautomerase family protein [Streptomyces sp. NBC_01335]|uniref:tautomerase family protein n=1 Tax=Streptomyces sp. NBC_01335 TaxID=2903828 RepID=UPI002E0DF74E|nr:4-oxalocrotonate tautomerase family protein [Streptomyces sp. NBC_01335]